MPDSETGPQWTVRIRVMGDRTECVFVCVSVLYESESKWVLDSWEVKGAKCTRMAVKLTLTVSTCDRHMQLLS